MHRSKTVGNLLLWRFGSATTHINVSLSVSVYLFCGTTALSVSTPHMRTTVYFLFVTAAAATAVYFISILTVFSFVFFFSFSFIFPHSFRFSSAFNHIKLALYPFSAVCVCVERKIQRHDVCQSVMRRRWAGSIAYYFANMSSSSDERSTDKTHKWIFTLDCAYLFLCAVTFAFRYYNATTVAAGIVIMFPVYLCRRGDGAECVCDDSNSMTHGRFNPPFHSQINSFSKHLCTCRTDEYSAKCKPAPSECSKFSPSANRLVDFI